MSAQALIRQASAAGVELRLIDGKVKASGTADALALMVDRLRENKAELLKYFSAYASNDPAPEPLDSPNAWRELAIEYHDHHFQCPTCQSAGRGAQYGLRCGVGAALWTNYQTTN